MEAWQNVEQHVKAAAESAEARVEQDLPVIGKFLSDASQNPVVAAIAGATHLPEVPALLQVIADAITSIDNALGDAKAQAGQTQPDATPQPAPPADPSAPVTPAA